MLLVARLPTRRSVRAGTVTTSGLGVTVLPSALLEYRVDTPVRWSATQNGLVGERPMPQGFLRLVSTITGSPPAWCWVLETRFVCLYAATASLRKISYAVFCLKKKKTQ